MRCRSDESEDEIWEENVRVREQTHRYSVTGEGKQKLRMGVPNTIGLEHREDKEQRENGKAYHSPFGENEHPRGMSGSHPPFVELRCIELIEFGIAVHSDTEHRV